MKTIIATVCLVAMALAEPPPSNSYLPPSPSSRSGGYPQGGPQGHGAHGGHGGHGGLGQAGPQIVAARNLDHGRAAGGFGKSAGGHGHKAQARFGGQGYDQQGYDANASPFGRSGLDDEEPARYNFGYMVNDYQEGTDFGHHEERQDERAEGEYHVVLPDGRKQTVSYEADERGFKPHISYEDSDALARSNGGYDSNANNLQHGGHANGANARSQKGY
ncbi:pro-resilin-like [Pectinophora gossypiella]|uniref:pro-resilin-like n=1 Tax=Pectinophora gossypiella TaxID=13191 RepID=UPI00214ECA8D|nr:pro-resilin-like [Pectinophora gossypiella]